MITREMAKWKIFFLVLRLQSRALWGSRAQRPFWFPFLIGRTAASMTFCEFQRAEQLLIKEGCSHRGNRSNSCDPMDTKLVAISLVIMEKKSLHSTLDIMCMIRQ